MEGLQMKKDGFITGAEGSISKGKIGALLLVLAGLLKMVGDYLTTGVFNPAEINTFIALLSALLGIMGYGIRDAL
jgi:hypothetical protein